MTRCLLSEHDESRTLAYSADSQLARKNPTITDFPALGRFVDCRLSNQQIECLYFGHASGIYLIVCLCSTDQVREVLHGWLHEQCFGLGVLLRFLNGR